MPNSLPCNAVVDERLRLIVESYRRLTGKALLDSTAPTLREALWDAPFAIVAHGTEADPIFFYGNRYALQSFEMSFDKFTCLPSRLSAEPLAQDARQKLLDKVKQHGYIDDYCGMRIAKSGRRFMIANATVWNLVDERGNHCGQAAMFAVAE
jgi:hypothetical protein